MTKYAPTVDLDVKFLERNEHSFRVFVPSAKTPVWIQEAQESLGKWKLAKPGDLINIRVSQDFVNQYELLGKQTWGTGTSGGESVGGGQISGLNG